MPIRFSEFRPHPLLRGPHSQTVLPTFVRKRPDLPVRRERLETPDGDFVDLLHLDPAHGRPRARAIYLHGLGGGIGSHYSGPHIQALANAGFAVTFLYLRGGSGEPNRLDRAYHSGDTADLALLAQKLRARSPALPLVAVGISMGGNILLKYLGERGGDSLIDRAVAVSVPFDLADAADTLNRGFARFYQRHLMNGLLAQTRAKFNNRPAPFDLARLDQTHTLFEFDDRVTAPLNGFAGARDYYARCSSRQFIPAIRTPTVILHSMDDPFMTREAIPSGRKLPAGVVLELSKHGGHVGFIGPGVQGGRFWLDTRIVAALGEAP
ncbi:MAG: hydrolase [Gammaproteobacteria bacterium]